MRKKGYVIQENTFTPRLNADLYTAIEMQRNVTILTMSIEMSGPGVQSRGSQWNLRILSFVLGFL